MCYLCFQIHANSKMSCRKVEAVLHITRNLMVSLIMMLSNAKQHVFVHRSSSSEHNDILISLLASDQAVMIKFMRYSTAWNGLNYGTIRRHMQTEQKIFFQKEQYFWDGINVCRKWQRYDSILNRIPIYIRKGVTTFSVIRSFRLIHLVIM